MNQVEEYPFEPKLCQDVATASRSPMECLLAPKTVRKSEKCVPLGHQGCLSHRQLLLVVVAGPGQGKAGKAGPGQTKPRLGTTGKPAKPKQEGFSGRVFRKP